MDTDDTVLAQLRKLREGVGLTPEHLGRSSAVMSALGMSDPQLAYERLLRILDELGQGERTQALKVDFGLDLPQLLQREPHPREHDWLGDRRSGFGQVVARDSKTLGRWSDRALSELRAKLLADQFTGHLIVLAAVEGDRIVGTTTIQQPIGDADSVTIEHTSTEYPNPSDKPSMPCLVYGYPRDWKPTSLTLGVAFRSKPYPAQIYAVVASNFFELTYAVERHPLGLVQEMTTCKFERPRTDRLYAIWWA